jgi:hypothetical protein
VPDHERRQAAVSARPPPRRAGHRAGQLTTDQRRADALRFYRSLGFRATHAGMKLLLSDAQGRSDG